MKASELIELLSKHPDYLVQIETKDTIDHIVEVSEDVFSEDEGWTFVLTIEGAQ
jgi:hypothetical protein